MGAALATWNDMGPGTAGRTGMPSRRGSGRSHLRLVPQPAPGLTTTTSGVPERTGMAHPGVRLTRWGRLALTLIVPTTLAGSLLLALTVAPGTAQATGQRVVLVQSGQTLSGLAQAYLPDRNQADAVSASGLANDPSSEHILAGQRLLIPGS